MPRSLGAPYLEFGMMTVTKGRTRGAEVGSGAQNPGMSGRAYNRQSTASRSSTACFGHHAPLALLIQDVV